MAMVVVVASIRAEDTKAGTSTLPTLAGVLDVGASPTAAAGLVLVRVEAVSMETIADQGFSRENQVVLSEIGRMPLVALMSRAITEVIRPIFTAVPIQILTSETIVVMLGIKLEDNIMAIIL
jgi:hypothetical protein